MKIEQQRLLENIQKNETAGKELFPKEQFVDASSLKKVQWFGGPPRPDFEIPENLENIKIAKSRITPAKGKPYISDNDFRTLAKEIRQASVLTSKGASVYILPISKSADGRNIAGPDALVNGELYEFKTITGSIKRFETRFRESREQGQNVYIRVINPNIPRDDVIKKMHNVLNNQKYTGGLTGNMLFSVINESSEILYRIRIEDLK